jgi:hypothetical protein
VSGIRRNSAHRFPLISHHFARSNSPNRWKGRWVDDLDARSKFLLMAILAAAVFAALAQFVAQYTAKLSYEPGRGLPALPSRARRERRAHDRLTRGAHANHHPS